MKAGAGANILRGVAGAGVLSLYDKYGYPTFTCYISDPECFCRFQELAWGKVYQAGSG